MENQRQNRKQHNIKVLDVFSKKIKNLDISKIIEKKYKTNDFILIIPHSGFLIPLKYKDRFNLNEKCLIEVDLYSNLPYQNNKGMHVISNLIPFFIDMNRNLSGDVKTIHHLQNDPFHYYNIDDELMLKKEYSEEEIQELKSYYNLFHDTIKNMIKKMKNEKGYALIIDGHSMTSVGLGRSPGTGIKRKDFVVGNLNNTSAHPEILKAFSDSLKIESEKIGMSFNENVPYSGGFISRIHSDPKNHVHVIQLEVVMKNYMIEATEDSKNRYKLKNQNLIKIQKLIQTAIDSAIKKADDIYSNP